MRETGPLLPNDWFCRGKDLLAAEILLERAGPVSIVAFLLQQASEKYLKGYLLSKGWRLRRIHDLGILVKEALALDTDFLPFVPSCQRITEYYVEMRYPTGVQVTVQEEALLADLEVVRALVRLIHGKLGSTGPDGFTCAAGR